MLPNSDTIIFSSIQYSLKIFTQITLIVIKIMLKDFVTMATSVNVTKHFLSVIYNKIYKTVSVFL